MQFGNGSTLSSSSFTPPPQIPTHHQSPTPSTSTAPSLHHPNLTPQLDTYISQLTKILSDDLYQAYLTKEGTDVELTVQYADGQASSFGLHSIIARRSPTLLDKLGPTIFLRLSDPTITSDSISLSLAFLYNPAVLVHLSPINCASALASASCLAIDPLANYAAGICSQAIKNVSKPDEVSYWLRFLEHNTANATLIMGDNSLPPNSNGKLMNGFGNGNANGNGNGHHHRRELSHVAQQVSRGLYRELVERLTVKLPLELGAVRGGVLNKGNEEGVNKMIQVLATLPFELFKQVLESSAFPILPGSQDMDRFNFAKKCVAERKRQSGPLASEFDETVVLQFGQQKITTGGGGSESTAVGVLRKTKKPSLWKVGPGSPMSSGGGGVQINGMANGMGPGVNGR